MINTKKFLERIKKQAQKNPQSIVFPESELDSRIIAATYEVAKQGLAYPILLGNETKILNQLKKINSKIPDTIQILDHHQNNSQKEYYSQKLFELRKNKGLSLEQASELLEDINYYGTMMVRKDHAQAMISGSTFPTNETIKPALQILRLKNKYHRVSSFFFMILDTKIYLFADCAININPNSEELAQTALDTAQTALKFHLKPKISFLSFSTQGSADHPSLQKIKEAVKIAKKENPNILIEGEVQVDTAISKTVAARKYPDSQIQGDSNILIFPDLNSANIAYKLVERLAKAKAIGPILQGLQKPVNDLSRGCSVDDIISLSAITTIEAQNLPFGIL